MAGDENQNGGDGARADGFAAAIALHQAGQLEAAAEAYRMLLRGEPDHAAAHANLGQVLGMLGYLKEAEAEYRDALRLNDREPGVWFNLGNLLRRQDRADEAVAAYRKALEIDTTFVEPHLNLAHVLRRQHAWEAAAASYRAFLDQRPDTAEAHDGLGRCLQASGKFNEAIAAFEAAIATGGESADMWGTLAVAYQGLGRVAKAAECFMNAVKAEPEKAGAWSNLAAALQLQGNHAEAEKCLRKAIALDANYAMAYANLGWTLKERFAIDEAINTCQRAIELEPDLAIAHANLAPSLIIQMRHDEAYKTYRRATELDPSGWSQWSSYLFALNYSDTLTPEDVGRAHIDWGERHGTMPPTVLGFGARGGDRKLRIGYVSPDFREHPVGFLIEPILTYRDRDHFEVVCYSHTSRTDSITERLRTLPDDWSEIGDLNDDEVAQRIYDDRIDILIDLAGHTASNRLPVFARRPAPLQVSYAGYITTTGLKTMDAVIHDHRTYVPGAERFYSEKIVPLDTCVYCYRPPEEAPDVAPAPASVNGFVTFGSFNNTPKLTPTTFDLWALVLKQVPTARLVLKAGALRDTGTQELIRERFAERGIDPARIEMLPPTFFEDHLQDYAKMDIALDSTPFTGGITSCQALWQGVPFVTLEGAAHVSRVGASILTTAGLDELIAGTQDAYVEAATKLAADLPGLINIRATMRERLAATTLIDGAAFTPLFEKALLNAWQEKNADS